TELFERYRLARELGVPPDAGAPGGTTCDTDLSRFFATGVPAAEDPAGPARRQAQSK
ncbi:TetR family transcriptional regulator, partial [Streptomyces olivaceus]